MEFPWGYYIGLNYLTSGHGRVLGHIFLALSQSWKRLCHLSSSLKNPGGRTLVSLAGLHCAFRGPRWRRGWGRDVWLGNPTRTDGWRKRGTILIKKGSAVPRKREGCSADKQKLSTTAEGHLLTLPAVWRESQVLHSSTCGVFIQSPVWLGTS